jgi:hypothetical protein
MKLPFRQYSALIILFGGILALYCCKKAPTYPVIPALTWVNATPNPVKIGTDSLVLKFAFTDGDGDLGEADTSIFVTDIRPNSINTPFTYTFNLPTIPSKGSYKQITGNISINMFSNNSCRPGRDIRDTVSYSIYVKDKAGHKSNTITTPPIIFLCN